MTARAGVAFPADARLVVSLADVTEDPPVVITEDSVTDLTARPIPFELRYDPARIDSARAYAVAARIVTGGEIIFASVTSQEVLTGGRGARVELPVEPATILGPLPPRAADIVVRLPTFERVDGSWQDGDAVSAISAYFQDGALRYLEERTTIGSAGSAANAYFFEQGALFYHETIKRLGAVRGTPAESRDEVAFRVLFAPDGTLDASAKWINGDPASFEDGEIGAALRHAAVLRDAALRLAAQES